MSASAAGVCSSQPVSVMPEPGFQIWQTNTSTHSSWYADSDDETDGAAAAASPSRSPAARRAPPPPTSSASSVCGPPPTLSAAVSRTGSSTSIFGELSTLSDITNRTLSECSDIATPQVELSFGPRSGSSAALVARHAAKRPAAATTASRAAAGASSPTVGDWTATLEYVLEDDKRAKAYGDCLQAGAAQLVQQVTADDESHVPRSALDALTEEVKSEESYGLEACAQQLAAAISSDSIPQKLKALNVLSHIVPTACPSFAQAVVGSCERPCCEARDFSKPHPIRGDQPAEMVRQSAAKALETLRRVQRGEICACKKKQKAPDLNSMSVAKEGAAEGAPAAEGGGAEAPGGKLRQWLNRAAAMVQGSAGQPELC